MWRTLSVFLAVWVITFLSMLISPFGTTSIQVDVSGNVNGTSQLFFASNLSGFTESRVSRTLIFAGDNNLRFPFSPSNSRLGIYQSWEPCDCPEGIFAIRGMSMRSSLLTWVIPLEQIQPGSGISAFTAHSDRVTVSIDPSSTNPQVLFSANLRLFYAVHLAVLAALSTTITAIMWALWRWRKKHSESKSMPSGGWKEYARWRIPIDWRRVLPAAGFLSAALVPLYLLRLILQGTPMQFNDYYVMTGQLFTPDGAFTPLGLLVHQNEHLVTLPKLVYIVNIWAFGGSNITLSLFVWLVSVVTAVAVFIGFREVFRVSKSTQVVLAWALAVLIFPLQALHNYLFGMSGTAWIMANLFAVCAILAASRRRPLMAGLFGACGTFTYGTGLAIWPALVLILILQRRFNAQDAWMLAIGAVSVAIERSTAFTLYYHPATTTDPLSIIRSVTITAGSLFSQSTDVALILGAVILALAGYLVHRSTSCWQAKQPVDALAGILAFGVLVFVMFALSRTGFGDDTLLSSRYMAVVALFVLSLVLLSLETFGESPAWRWTAFTLLAVTLTVAVPTITAFQSLVRQQDIGAIAARSGVGEGIVAGYTSTSTPTLEALNHYPFNESGDKLACGLLGEKISEQQIAVMGPVQGWVDSIEPSSNRDAVTLTGWAYSPEPINCILVLDSVKRVVGAAVGGGEREDIRELLRIPEVDVGWSGIARATASEDLQVVVRVEGDPALYALLGADSGNE